MKVVTSNWNAVSRLDFQVGIWGAKSRISVHSSNMRDGKTKTKNLPICLLVEISKENLRYTSCPEK